MAICWIGSACSICINAACLCMPLSRKFSKTCLFLIEINQSSSCHKPWPHFVPLATWLAWWVGPDPICGSDIQKRSVSGTVSECLRWLHLCRTFRNPETKGLVAFLGFARLIDFETSSYPWLLGWLCQMKCDLKAPKLADNLPVPRPIHSRPNSARVAGGSFINRSSQKRASPVTRKTPRHYK